jgi:hypothetical protein
VFIWDHDLPGWARAGDIRYLKNSITHFYGLGVRLMTAEASDDWAPNGLGYYIASRLLWDVKESSRVDALVQDFLVKSFGDARGPMAEFYRLIGGSGKPPVTADRVRRMYSLLRQAGALSRDPKVRARIDDLILYTRYVELYQKYSSALFRRQAAFEELIRFVHRIRGTGMVHSRGLWLSATVFDKSLSLPPGYDWASEATERFGRAELDSFAAAADR